MVEFLDHRGGLTTDAVHLKEWMEAQFMEADKANDVEKLNNLSGPIAHYYVNVFKTGFVKPERWFAETVSFARNAWEIMQYVEQKAAKELEVAEAAQTAKVQSNAVADELQKFKESIAMQVAELEKANADLQAKLNAALASKPGRKPKAETSEPTADEKPEEAEATEEA